MRLNGVMKKIEKDLWQAAIPALGVSEFGTTSHNAKIMLKAKILSFAPGWDFNLIYDGEDFWLETKDFIKAAKLVLSRNGRDP